MSRDNITDANTQDKSCVIATTKILGDKWTPILLFALAERNLRFSELQEESGGVNPRTLSARLDAMEQKGIVKRTVYPEVPPRVEYALTAKGKDLIPVLKSMIDWAYKYDANYDIEC
jgi:DNA-binding HxlR family transcriptional regulator